MQINIADIDIQYRNDAKQRYTFDLLTPNQFPGWFADLKNVQWPRQLSALMSQIGIAEFFAKPSTL